MSKKINTAVFDVKIDDKEVTLMARKPTLDQQREGQRVYNTAFNDAISSGALLREKLGDFMREQGLWDDEKQLEMTTLVEEMTSIEKKLAKGGIKLTEARDAAIELSKLRNELNILIAKKGELDVHTAQGQADNARFNYWVSVCVVYNDSQKLVFAGLDDYLENSTEDYAITGASKVAELLYDLHDDYGDKLAENKFLREFGFADEKNRLVNKDGHLISTEGKLIDEDGNYVNEAGEKVDVDGNLLDDDNNYVYERLPFLNDEDEPISTIKECDDVQVPECVE